MITHVMSVIEEDYIKLVQHEKNVMNLMGESLKKRRIIKMNKAAMIAEICNILKVQYMESMYRMKYKDVRILYSKIISENGNNNN